MSTSRITLRLLPHNHQYPRLVPKPHRKPISTSSRPRSSPMDVVVPSPGELKVTSRRQYNPSSSLSPTSISPNPFEQFRTWLTEVQADVLEPEAMSLSTVTRSGVPSSRYVLLKQLDRRGFVFFTNYTSRKSGEMSENPRASLVFYWREVHRQVRVVGRVEKVTKDESEEYFNTRPVGSRLGAWASPQSKVVKEGELTSLLEEVKQRFKVEQDTQGAQVPLPEFWGGWRVVPDEIEFWLGKPSRLHDRVRYLRVSGPDGDEAKWQIDRLAP